MIKERAWPARAMYILLAAALAISLMIVAAPAQKVSAAPGLSEWTRVDTPTTDGWVLAPESVIIDYALDAVGEVAYAIVYQMDVHCPEPCPENGNGNGYCGNYSLLKSDDYAATWDDITDELEELLDDGDYIDMLLHVATDWVDGDFVAVALWWWDDSMSDYFLHVFFSTDGGETFEDAGEVEDNGWYLDWVSDLAVSYEADGERDIVIGGDAWNTTMYLSGLFRSTVDVDSANADDWEDATAYPGWDDDDPADLLPSPFTSEFVTDIIFSPSWSTDKTVLVTTITPVFMGDYDIHLQCGSFGTNEGWNDESTLRIEAVEIMEDVDIPYWLAEWDGRGIAGIALPEDYDSDGTTTRVLWVWVNYYDEFDKPACAIMRVDNDDAGNNGPQGLVDEGEVWLTNISYKGTIEQGEALAGVLGTGTYEDYCRADLLTLCCEGVQVYHNDGIRDMIICCEPWRSACEPELPTGKGPMEVS
jgi:hypothetical protein